MAIQHWYNGIIVLDAIQLRDERGFAASAELGQVEVVGVMVEDPGGTRDYVGLKSWQIKETTAADPVIWNGFVTRQRIHRGESDRRYPTGAGRVWELELTECNGMLSRKVIRSGANRSSETVAARITWLLTTTGMTGVVVDHGLVESCTTVMDANDYTGQFAVDVLRDCALISGWNFFVRWRAASSDLELIFSDFDLSALDASTLNISNVLTDVDLALTWFPGQEATLVRDPTRIAAGVWLPYANGNAYGSNATTAATFADVDQVAPTSTVKTSGAATALVNRFLASHNVQDERVESVRLTVPRANVNDVKHGQVIDARFSHLPGWTTTKPARVLYKSVGLFADSPDAYTADLVLSSVGPYCTATDQFGSPISTLANGFYPPLFSATSAANGLITYETPGQTADDKPWPGFVGHWAFAVFNQGGVDYAGDCTESTARCFILGGPGTFVGHTAVYTQARTLGAYLYHKEGLFVIQDDYVQFACGSDVTIQVPDDQAHCIHWVEISDKGETNPCGDKWGFAGFTWTRTRP